VEQLIKPMDTLYVFLFIIILVALFYAIPWLIDALKGNKNRRLGANNGSNADAATESKRTDDVGNNYKEAAALVDPIYLPEPSGKADKKLEPTKEMIDMYYKNEVSEVPEQYCYKPIGECPHSKPMSTDLPIANVPMCMATQENNMRLQK